MLRISDFRRLVALAAGQAVLYAVIAWLSRQFHFGEGFQQRPIVAVVALFAACFGLYVASLACALRVRPAPFHFQQGRLAWAIVLPAVVFRGILLFSQPIQEIDIYRYLWDGAVASRGVSPFRYSPGQVLAAEARTAAEARRLPAELQRIARIGDESPALTEILRRIHYPELTTVYPLVSQAVFALADRLTPPAADVSARVTIMKGVLLAFDLATIGLVWLLLCIAGKHAGWVIAYAWCPLVMKEFANSGHLDSIAVCLTTATLWCACVAARDKPHRSLHWQTVAGVLLGLAVGAKLYAIVLLPLLTAMVGRRRGTRRGAPFALVAVAISCATLVPMFPAGWTACALGSRAAAEPPRHPVVGRALLPVAGTTTSTSARPTEGGSTSETPSSGLGVFLSRWEMNDFLFMLVVENIRPCETKPQQPAAWFAVVPHRWQAGLVGPVADVLSIDAGRAAFLLARILTGGAFVAIALFLLWRAARRDSLAAWLEAAFLTLAWFWLLSPTQNPWYWTWAVPLLAFARGRAWLALSGVVFAYYLRFWLSYHWPDSDVLGAGYRGPQFFDYLVTWIEFGPWFVWLASAALWPRRAGSCRENFDADCVIEFTEGPASLT